MTRFEDLCPRITNGHLSCRQSAQRLWGLGVRLTISVVPAAAPDSLFLPVSLTPGSTFQTRSYRRYPIHGRLREHKARSGRSFRRPQPHLRGTKRWGGSVLGRQAPRRARQGHHDRQPRAREGSRVLTPASGWFLARPVSVYRARPTVVVLIHGSPLAIPGLAQEAATILDGFYLGEETGIAIANVLFGDAEMVASLQTQTISYRKYLALNSLLISSISFRPSMYG